MHGFARATLSASVILAVLAGPAPAAAQTGKAGLVRLSVELPDDPSAGMRLFGRKGCVLCHTLGDREKRAGPDLGQTREPGSILDLAGDFWNHAPVMRAKMQELGVQPPTLATDEMANLAAFLTAYRYYQTALGQPGNATAGRGVYTAKGCAGCHNSDSARGALGPNLQRYHGRSAGLFLAQAMWNHGPEMAAAMRTRGVAWPSFGGREMTDLVAYLQSESTGPPETDLAYQFGNPRLGRAVFVAKRCNGCHGLGASHGRAPDLAARGLLASIPTIAGIMWNHSQPMAAEFARQGIPLIKFDGSEMADLLAYLYFVNYSNVEGNATRGARQFADKCVLCHGAGKGVAPDLQTGPGLGGPIAIVTAMWNHAPRMEAELQKRGLAWPRFEPGDAADLAAFLMRPPQAARVSRVSTRQE